ncbi:hypothetical protein [Schlesneria sp. DSM 10557]|uniref:hypothetical protein n=1 Tax=Schlesneria sp. DSM 10557 TaxID=3044399 RepID=UPI00359FE982
MSQFHQALLIGSTILLSWFGMQQVHELGHVVGAILTGGTVKRVVVHPAAISRTDLATNPKPLLVAWAGSLFGAVAPTCFWGMLSLLRVPGAFVMRFFAGFCLIANGAYIAFGSLPRIGDSADLLSHGAPIWLLWFFGAVTIPLGLLLWNGQGVHFGLGATPHRVSPPIAWGTFFACFVFLLVGVCIGGN